MVRRSLRLGIRLGVLAGLAFALFKIVQARRPTRASSGGDDPWASRPRGDEPGQPALVRPTMLESVSVRDRPGAPSQAAPRPAPTPAPAPTPTSSPAPPAVPAGPEIEPDDDEVVILSTGEEGGDTTDLPRRPAEAALGEKASARKASARKASAEKPSARKRTGGTRAAKKAATAVAWVEPEGDVCPGSHPIKAKLRSGIFHLPGMAAYARTRPDRCYSDEAAAERDGLRRAAR